MTGALILLFAAVVAVTFALYFGCLALSRSMQVKRRLRQVAETPTGVAPGPSRTGLLREETPGDRILQRLPLTGGLTRLVNLSGVDLTPLGVVLVTCGLSVSSFLVAFLWKENAVAAVLAAVLAGCLPYAFLQNRRQKRGALFDEQLPEVLTLIARSLRAGHSLSTAVELAGEELPEPSGGLFRTAYEQQRLGVRISEALSSLRTRIECVDYNFFVTIVKINSENGGNLSEILEKLAETIRSRQQIRRQVKVCTAEGRYSGYVLLGLPVLLFCALSISRPQYMHVFYANQLAKLILGGTVVSQIIGFLIIRKIVDIRI